MKEKLIPAVFLAAVFCLLLGSAVFADADRVYDVDATGIHVLLPESWTSEAISISFEGQSIDVEDEVFETDAFMIAASAGEIREAAEKYGTDSEEFNAFMASRYYYLFEILSIKDTIGMDGFDAWFREYIGAEDLSSDDFRYELEKIGSTEGWTFCRLNMQNDEKNPAAAADPEKQEIIDRVLADIPSAIENMSFSRPQGTMDSGEDIKISFETTDLDGNPVTSEELFADNKITMINYWFSTCKYCLNEMPELEEIYQSLRKKGCGVVGITVDAYNDRKIADNKKVLEENGITYPNVIGTWEMQEQLDIHAFPTTYFVDRNGTVLRSPIAGAMPQWYEAAVDRLLDDESDVQSAAPEADAESEAPEADGKYRVHTADEDGKPVPEVYIQFCSDELCLMEKTDENGDAFFEYDAGTSYEVHVRKVPDGYEEDETVYEADSASAELEITLKKA